MSTYKDKKAIEAFREKVKRINEATTINPFETKAEQQRRVDRAKKDVAFFVRTYLPHYATAESADFQIDLANKVKRNNNCKILVRWGRGLAKSVWCDVVIPLWLWINGEEIYLVLVGNNLDKAKILLSDVQAEFEGNYLLTHDFGEQVKSGDWTDGYFITKGETFIGKALGMGQSPRGLRMKDKRPNLIVPDDLEDKDTVKNPRRQDEVVTWIEQDLIPTMDDKGRRYLHPNNNFAPRTIQEQLRRKHENWMLHQVNAYNPVTYEPRWIKKYNRDHYREIEGELGTIAALAEYNNTPYVKGKVFKDEYIQWGKAPRIDRFEHVIGYWDVAYSDSDTADFNAVKIWGLKELNFYCIKAFVRQCRMYEAIEWMFMYTFMLPPGVSVNFYYEAQFWNESLQMVYNQVAKKYRPIPLIQDDRRKPNKYDRIISMLPYYQQGRMFYDEREFSSNDMQTGLMQLKGIEPGYRTKDDSPDADEGAIYMLTRHMAAKGEMTTGHNRRNDKKY